MDTADFRADNAHAQVKSHIGMMHRLAESLKNKSKLVLATYGESPETRNELTPVVEHFQVGDVEGMVDAAIRLGQEPHRNVYMPVAVFRPDLPGGRKGSEADIVAVFGLVADLDDANAANWATRSPIPPNYVIESSNGRFQAFWLFDKPVAPAEAKVVAKKLKEFCRCDSGTSDISHVWRISGTLNWPNSKKVSEGRPVEPQLARVALPWAGTLTKISDLAAALEKASGAQSKTDSGHEKTIADAMAELNANLGAILEAGSIDDARPLVDRIMTSRGAHSRWSGCTDGLEDTSRSVMTFAFISALKAAGFSLVETAILARLHEFGELGGRKYDDIADELRVIARCWGRCKGNPGQKATTSAERGKPTLRDVAVARLLAAGVTLWTTPAGVPHATLPRNGSVKHVALNSGAGSDAILALLYRLDPDKLPTMAQLEEIVSVLSARAKVSGNVHEAHLRTGRVGDTLFLDMADEAGQVIEITSAGWQVMSAANAPIRFVQLAGLLPLPVPACGGGADFLVLIRRHLNLPHRCVALTAPGAENDSGVIADAMVLAAITSWVNRTGSVFHVALLGAAGCGKTTAARMLRGTFDPVAAPTTPAPANIRDLVTLAGGNAVLLLDNVSRLSSDLADIFCVMATGGAWAARALYSNADISQFSIRCPVVFTSVETGLLGRGDLLERTLRIHLEPITERRTDEALIAAWAADHPVVLGLLLDALAGGLAHYVATAADVRPDELPRMAGAALFAEAVARGLGWPKGLMLRVLRSEQAAAQVELAEDDPLVCRLRTFLRSTDGRWSGTASELLASVVETSGPGWRHGDGIRSPAALGAALDRLAGSFCAMGWLFHRGHEGRGVPIRGRPRQTAYHFGV